MLKRSGASKHNLFTVLFASCAFMESDMFTSCYIAGVKCSFGWASAWDKTWRPPCGASYMPPWISLWPAQPVEIWENNRENKGIVIAHEYWTMFTWMKQRNRYTDLYHDPFQCSKFLLNLITLTLLRIQLYDCISVMTVCSSQYFINFNNFLTIKVENSYIADWITSSWQDTVNSEVTFIRIVS